MGPLAVVIISLVILQYKQSLGASVLFKERKKTDTPVTENTNIEMLAI